tara:strand:- start:10053 stop:10385 length:333 start_codon:yes stop_codon:yes gene_type:complete
MTFDYNIEDHLAASFPEELVPKLEVIPIGTQIKLMYGYDKGNPAIFNRIHGDLPADPAELEVNTILLKRPTDLEFNPVGIEDMFAIEWFITEYAYDEMEEDALNYLQGDY